MLLLLDDTLQQKQQLSNFVNRFVEVFKNTGNVNVRFIRKFQTLTAFLSQQIRRHNKLDGIND